jgi:hypothetical protein
MAKQVVQFGYMPVQVLDLFAQHVAGPLQHKEATVQVISPRGNQVKFSGNKKEGTMTVQVVEYAPEGPGLRMMESEQTMYVHSEACKHPSKRNRCKLTYKTGYNQGYRTWTLTATNVNVADVPRAMMEAVAHEAGKVLQEPGVFSVSTLVAQK